MKSQKEKINLIISYLIKLHTIVILLWFLSAYLMFFSSKYSFLGSFYLIIVGISNIMWDTCPLTKLEHKLLRFSNNKEKPKNFTPRFFKKYFGFEISYKLVKIVIIIFMVLAIFYLIESFHLPS